MDSTSDEKPIKRRGVLLPHLRAWRDYFGYTVRELEQLSKVSHSNITKYETGQLYATPKVISKLADGLGISRTTLLHVDPTKVTGLDEMTLERAKADLLRHSQKIQRNYMAMLSSDYLTAHSA